MKLVRRHKAEFLFEISEMEKDLMLHVLNLYPLVPATHHRLSKGRQIPDQAANQHLLEEALKHQRTENQKQLRTMLNEAKRFTPCKAGHHFTLTRSEIEWLLQVFNDVRVGCWIALGSPEQEQAEKYLEEEETSAQVAVMQIAGGFEMLLLDALTGKSGDV